ncbi:YkvA family protein [Virgibacillus sp. W0181]|uniref:YkvA family protein n=1 Tax=Virgibacillus sp. W0181 TaxID=3391581 RepID=UPI003F44DD5A
MKRFFNRFLFLAKFHKSIPFVKDFFMTKEVKKGRKVFFAVVIIGYIVFPFDLIPDFIFGFGVIDDITITAFLLQQMIKYAPQSLKDKHHIALRK